MAWTQVLAAFYSPHSWFLALVSSANMDVLRRLFPFSSPLDFSPPARRYGAWPVSVIISGGCACQIVHVLALSHILSQCNCQRTRFRSTNNKEIQAECARRESIRICKADRAPICRHYTPSNELYNINFLQLKFNVKKKKAFLDFIWWLNGATVLYRIIRQETTCATVPNSNVIEN